MKPLQRPILLALAALSPLAALALAAPLVRISLAFSLAISFSCTIATVAIGAHAAQHARLGERVARSIVSVLAGIVTGAVAFYFARGAGAGSLRDVASGLGATAAILLVATAVGALVGWRVPLPGHLLPVALVSSAVDLWSVFAPEGPTRAIAEAPDPAVLRVLAVSAAVAPSRAMEPMLGFADVIFASLYLSAARRHGLSLARTTAAIIAGLLLAGFVAVLLRRPLPALPFLGLCVVLFVRGSRAVPREDRAAVWVAAGLLVAACGRLAYLRLGR